MDFIEVGMPFSDPVADGPVIQKSSSIALQNGMNSDVLFEQLESIKQINIPKLIMGYINPVLKYGFERFLMRCKDCGVDGLIIPDLPLEEYDKHYKLLFRQYGIHNVLLISPETPDDRIKLIAKESTSFIYIVSSNSITGSSLNTDNVVNYFKRVKSLVPNKPLITGFGISSFETFKNVCQYTNGAIIGSAFVKAIDKKGVLNDNIENFLKQFNN